MPKDTKKTEDAGGLVEYWFEGKRLEGIAGEPIARALFRAGIRTLSYSIKYHRPRGIHCARGRCGMCHMEVDGFPGVPTCITPLEGGMRIKRENFRPLYGRVFELAARALPLPAGFYYRFFTRPVLVRSLFQKSLRSMAGVGRISMDISKVPRRQGAPSLAAARDSYDVVVVGAGVSGLSAALSAARRGATVLLVDEYAEAGGHSLGFCREAELASRRDKLIESLGSASRIEFFPNTTAQGFYPPETILLGNRSGMRCVKGRAFVFATGAHDIIPLFINNDIPGIFGLRAVKLLLERDRLVPGKTAIVYGSGSPAADAIELMRSHGIEVSALVDTAKGGEPPHHRRGMKQSLRYLLDTRLIKAHGRSWVRAATFSPAASRGQERRKRLTLPCDMLCIAFAGQGAYELPYQAGFSFELSGDPLGEAQNLLPRETRRLDDSRAGFFLAGELTGEVRWEEKIEQGEKAGKEAAAFSSKKREEKWPRS